MYIHHKCVIICIFSSDSLCAWVCLQIPSQESNGGKEKKRGKVMPLSGRKEVETHFVGLFERNRMFFRMLLTKVFIQGSVVPSALKILSRGSLRRCLKKLHFHGIYNYSNMDAWYTTVKKFGVDLFDQKYIKKKENCEFKYFLKNSIFIYFKM